MKTIYKSALLASAMFVQVWTVSAQQQEDATLKPSKIITTTTVQPQVTQPVNGEDITVKTQPTPSVAPATTNAAAAPRVAGVDPTNGEQIKAPVNNNTAGSKPATAAKTNKPAPVTVYAEGKQKGQPIYTPGKSTPVADPAKQAKEKAMVEERNRTHPARITNTTAAQKAAYPAKRQAELSARQKH